MKAWSVVFGAWCAMVPSMGLLNSLRILHAWISALQLKTYSKSSIRRIFGGGVVFPLIIILFATPKIDFPWAIRIIALLCAILCTISILLLKTSMSKNTKVGASIDFRALKDPRYAATTAAFFLVEFAVLIPITYIASYTINAGMETKVSYLLIVFLESRCHHRTLSARLDSKWMGRFNVMVLISSICAILALALYLTKGSQQLRRYESIVT